VVIFLAVVLAAHALAGCTVLGFGIGEAVDHDRYQAIQSVENAVFVVQRGDIVRVTDGTGRSRTRRFVAWSDTTDVYSGFMVVGDLKRKRVFAERVVLDSIRVRDIDSIEIHKPPVYGPILGVLGIAVDVVVASMLRDAFSGLGQ
jgi:hypothetical protein